MARGKTGSTKNAFLFLKKQTFSQSEGKMLIIKHFLS